MRRFHFPLDPALRLRRRLEDQAQLDLSESLRQMEEAHAAVSEAQGKLERCQLRRAALQHAVVELRMLVEEDCYGEQLARELSERQRQLAEAMAAAETARSALRQCRIDREALERLRERRLAEHRVEELHVEQQEMDEISVLRWRRDDS